MASVSTLTLTSWGGTTPRTSSGMHTRPGYEVTSYRSPHIIVLISMDPSPAVSRTPLNTRATPAVRQIPGHLILHLISITSYQSPHIIMLLSMDPSLAVAPLHLHALAVSRGVMRMLCEGRQQRVTQCTSY